MERPKLRGTTKRFALQLFGTGVLRTNALKALVIASSVRGQSVRDVEATLTEALGEQASVTKSTVSRICAELPHPARATRSASGGGGPECLRPRGVTRALRQPAGLPRSAAHRTSPFLVFTTLPASRLPSPPPANRADPAPAHSGDQVTDGQRRLPMPPLRGPARR